MIIIKFVFYKRNIYIYVVRLQYFTLVSGIISRSTAGHRRRAQWFEWTYIIFGAEGVNMMSQSHLLARLPVRSVCRKTTTRSVASYLWSYQKPMFTTHTSIYYIHIYIHIYSYTIYIYCCNNKVYKRYTYIFMYVYTCTCILFIWWIISESPDSIHKK